MSSIFLIAKNSFRNHSKKVGKGSKAHKVTETYPVVSINEVNTKRAAPEGKKQLLYENVEDLFPSKIIRERYIKSGLPVPIRYRVPGDEISRFVMKSTIEEIETGQPHFKVGLKKIYFPNSRVALLRSSAKLTPNQARFLVPRNFNRMDLRDYLWHIYGLRVTNVTVLLTPATFRRGNDDHARYRVSQQKKMTVLMEKPFIWPEIDPDLIEKAEYEHVNEMEIVKHNSSLGSDKNKPIEAFEKVFKQKTLPEPFISKKMLSSKQNEMEQYRKHESMKDSKEMVKKYLEII